jgi:hypothetical protein
MTTDADLNRRNTRRLLIIVAVVFGVPGCFIALAVVGSLLPDPPDRPMGSDKPADNRALERPTGPTPDQYQSRGFGNGSHVVGTDVVSGTYRSQGSGMCYWARLRDFDGDLNSIIANGNNAPEIVTLRSSDRGFETRGCGRWFPVAETATTQRPQSFSDGTFAVGTHIEPGEYRSAGDVMCYWARLKDFSHELSGHTP